MLAATSSHDIQILWVILAIICFAVGVYLAYVHNYIGAVIAAFIGVVVVVLAVQ
jgi:hypothetical protein